jgi:hypothetical protein
MSTTKRATGATRAGDESAFPAMDPNLLGAAYGQTMLEMQREWLAGMGQIQRDYLTFIGERMRKDIEIAKRMAECRDVQAAMELQSAFVETARDDYLEEAQKLLAMGRELTESCVERLAEAPTKTNGRDATAN